MQSDIAVSEVDREGAGEYGKKQRNTTLEANTGYLIFSDVRNACSRSTPPAANRRPPGPPRVGVSPIHALSDRNMAAPALRGIRITHINQNTQRYYVDAIMCPANTFKPSYVLPFAVRLPAVFVEAVIG